MPSRGHIYAATEQLVLTQQEDFSGQLGSQQLPKIRPKISWNWLNRTILPQNWRYLRVILHHFTMVSGEEISREPIHWRSVLIPAFAPMAWGTNGHFLGHFLGQTRQESIVKGVGHVKWLYCKPQPLGHLLLKLLPLLPGTSKGLSNITDSLRLTEVFWWY